MHGACYLISYCTPDTIDYLLPEKERKKMKGKKNAKKWNVICSIDNDYELAIKLAKFLENYVLMLARAGALREIDTKRERGFYPLKQLLSQAKKLGTDLGVLDRNRRTLFYNDLNVVTDVRKALAHQLGCSTIVNKKLFIRAFHQLVAALTDISRAHSEHCKSMGKPRDSTRINMPYVHF